MRTPLPPRYGETALGEAVINGHAKVVAALLRAGADPHALATSRADETPLYLAVFYRCVRAGRAARALASA